MSRIAVLILAGGSGTRLWPYVDKNVPKFLFKPFGKPVISNTIEFARELVADEFIFILTTKKQKSFLTEYVPKNLQNNILVEPSTKDTAFALIYGAFKIFQKIGPVFLLNLATDHIIDKINEFKKGLKFATNCRNYLYLFTTPIQFPSIHQGYVKIGKKISQNIYKVEKFIEKPAIKQAKVFIKNKNFRWNCGIFFWHFSVFIPECKKIKRLFDFLYYVANYNTEKAYSLTSPGSIEFSLLQKTKILATPYLDIGWSDIGTWENLTQYLLTKDKNCMKKNLACYNANNISVFGDFNKIKVIGLKDLIVIKRKNDLLISKYGETFHLKNITS